MSHPRNLIEMIASRLHADYPVSAFDYVFEKALPGTKLFPDIAVVNRISGTIACVCEIGYTRPEKLTAYRTRLRIPDVRWYDKSGQLHADVQQKHLDISVSLQVEHDCFAYIVDGEVFFCEEDGCDEDGLEVKTFLFTDYYRAFVISHCDVCDRAWQPDEIDVANLLEDLRDKRPQELARQWGSRQSGHWSQMVAFALREFDIRLDYRDGHIVRDGDLALQVNRVVRAEREREQ